MEKKILALRGVQDVGKTSCLKDLIRIVSESADRLIECGALYPYSKLSDRYIKGTKSVDVIEDVEGDVYGIFELSGSIIAIISQGDVGALLKDAFDKVDGIIKQYTECKKIEKALLVCAVRRRGGTPSFLKEISDGVESVTIIDKMAIKNLNHEENPEMKHVQSWINEKQAIEMFEIIEYLCAENEQLEIN